MRPNLRLAATCVLAATLVLAAAPLAAAPPDALPIYDTSSVGALAIEAASRAAAESGRRLLVNFGTNDCEPCRSFNDAVFEEPFRSAFFAQFVPVFVDVAPGTANRDLLGRYGIDPAKGFPAVVFSDEQLRIGEVTKDGEIAAVAAKGKDAVREWLLKRFRKDEKAR